MIGSILTCVAILTSSGPPDDTPRARYEAIVKEFDSASQSATDAMGKAKDERERSEAALRRPQPREFAPRFLALAEAVPDDPAALDALIWVAESCMFGPEAEAALVRIARDHARDDRLKDFCGRIARYGEPCPTYEAMLRSIMTTTPHRDVKGAATLALAEYLKIAKERTESRLVELGPDVGQRRLSPSQMAEARRIKDRGLDAIGAESAALFREVIDHHADLRIKRLFPQDAADLARGELFALQNLGIGRKAPEIVGREIHGKPMALADYRGKVVVLDFGSHRSCGICRVMYPRLRAMVRRFEGQPFALIGISVDDDLEELLSVAEKGETTWPVWLDGENLGGPLATRWSIRGMPTYYILDRDGVIRNKGFLQVPEITATVEMLLKERGESAP